MAGSAEVGHDERRADGPAQPAAVQSTPEPPQPATEPAPEAPTGATAAPASSPGRFGVPGRLARRTAVRAWDDDIFSESASAAFWQTLSLPPLLLGIFGVLGYAADWFGPGVVTAVQDWIVQATGGVFNRSAVEQIIAPTVRDILTTARGEVVSVGFLLSLWSGSSAMAAFVDAITRAHGQYPLRNLVWQRVLSILLYTVALVFGIIALPVVAIGPDRLPGLLPEQFRPAVESVVSALTTPVVGLVLVLALTTLYRIALPFKPPWWRGLPGALLAAVVFLLGVTGLRGYLDWITSTGYTYGALAAPIAFLLATFFIALAIVLGAYLNAAVQLEWPAPLRRRGREVAPHAATDPLAAGDRPALAAAVRRDPETAAAALAQLRYRVSRPTGTEDRPAPEDRRDSEDRPVGDQDHAPPDMAADRAR